MGRSQANNVYQIGARYGKLRPANTADGERKKYVRRYPLTFDFDDGTLASAQENAPCANNAA